MNVASEGLAVPFLVMGILLILFALTNGIIAARRRRENDITN